MPPQGYEQHTHTHAHTHTHTHTPERTDMSGLWQGSLFAIFLIYILFKRIPLPGLLCLFVGLHNLTDYFVIIYFYNCYYCYY